MKKKLILLGVLGICLAILSSGTIAYFTAEDTAHNVITSGGIEIAIIEKTDGKDGALLDFPKEGLSGVMPGTSASKIVSVQNSGASETWIRVKVAQEIFAADGSELPILINGSIPVMTFEVDNTRWTLKNDWYYYRDSVAPTAVTDILFEEVKFASEMGNQYQNCKANLSIYAQAVQTANNGSSALNAAGWPMEVTD